MAKSIASPVTAKVVRAFFASNPTLAPAEASDSLREGQRGRLHPSAIVAFNDKAEGQVYAEGNKREVELPYVVLSKTGAKLKRTARVSQAEARRLSGTTAARGRLSKGALVTAGEAYAASLVKVETPQV